MDPRLLARPSCRRLPSAALSRLLFRRTCAAPVLVAAACLPAAGPAWAGQAARVITIDSVRGIPRCPLRAVTDYEGALASTVSVLEQDLGFPRLASTVLLLPDSAALRDSLLREGHPASVSAEAAEALSAVASAHAVRINERAMRRLQWPARVHVVAHELAHVAQNQLSGGRKGTSEQWLREGLAEWVAWRVLEILGHGELRRALREARDGVGWEGRRGWRPRLADLSTFDGWVRSMGERPARLLYDEALLATSALIEEHGLPAVLDYFSRAAGCDDRKANFRAAFGQEGTSFEARFDYTVTALIRH